MRKIFVSSFNLQKKTIFVCHIFRFIDNYLPQKRQSTQYKHLNKHIFFIKL